MDLVDEKTARFRGMQIHTLIIDDMLPENWKEIFEKMPKDQVLVIDSMSNFEELDGQIDVSQLKIAQDMPVKPVRLKQAHPQPWQRQGKRRGQRPR